MTARSLVPAAAALMLALVGRLDAGAQSPPDAVALSLEDAVARGLGASHRVAEATARGDAAASLVDQRRAANQPRLAAQAGYTRTNHVDEFGVPLPNNQLRVIYPDIPNNYRARLDAQWPVYSGGRIRALERAAQSEARAAGLDRSATEADVTLDIARAYWTLVSATASVTVLDEALTRADAHVRDARNRFDAGLTAPNDVLSAEAQRSRQRMLRVQAAAQQEVAESALARLTGLPPGTRIVATSALEPPASLDPAALSADPAASRETPAGARPVDDLVRRARDARADRRALAERIVTTEHRSDAAAAGRRPTVALAGGVDLARPNPRIFPRDGVWRESWDASIVFDWPLFDGGRARAEVAEATASKRAAEARLAEVDSLLALEIRQRTSELTSSRAAVTAADDGLRAASEARRVVTDRYGAGVATATDVLDAQLAVLQAGLDRTQALASWRIAEAGLARAVGTPASR